MSSKSGIFKNIIVRSIIVIFVALLIVVFRFDGKIDQDKSPAERFVVVKIIDGDTVELKGGDKLRLLAVDTPEKGELFYDEACQLLAELTLEKEAVIQYASRRRDKYGRLLGYLYIDGAFINEIILKRGMGNLYLFKDNKLGSPEINTMLSAQKAAIGDKIGLWSIQRSPEDYYINLEGSFRFHRPGCRSIKKSKPVYFQKLASREEGMLLGLSPCRNCKP